MRTIIRPSDDEPWLDWTQLPAGCTCQWDTPHRYGLGVAGGNGLNGTWRRTFLDPDCQARHPEGMQP